jgi:hypothetical protein
MNATELLQQYAEAQAARLIHEETPEVRAYLDNMALVVSLEKQVKDTVKQEGCPLVTASGYEAVLTVRHGAPSIVWKIPELEAAFPWAGACIVKAVDEKALVAVAKAKSVDLAPFAVVTPGTETKAVSVHLVEAHVALVRA